MLPNCIQQARSASAAASAAACAVAALALTTPTHSQCLGDIDGSGQAGGTDLTNLLSSWGTFGQGQHDADLNDDGTVGGTDLTILLSAWGPCSIVPSWATLVEALPNPAVVTSATVRQAIAATGYAWRVRDTATQIEMVLIPPGSFPMGCSASNQSACSGDESPVHTVTLTSAFYMGRYEVTQAQWQAQMDSNPSAFQGAEFPNAASRPVEQVSWEAAGEFLQVAGMRLPTEAEWEYAYRAGTATAFHGIPSAPDGVSDDAQLGQLAWFGGNNGASGTAAYGTKPVGQKLGNGFGVHDMVGNVF
jgi:formylglycine-generating enzyme required for sulfatase activity